MCFSRSEVDCKTGFVDLLGIPLAKGVPLAVPSQQRHAAVLPQASKDVEGKQLHVQMSFYIVPFVSLPVLPVGRN